MMSGLPSSGKTTKATELLKTIPNSVRINRDDMRAMLFKDLTWHGKFEETVVSLQREMVKHCLIHRHTVIIDDCNLTKRNTERWANLASEIGVKFEVFQLDTDVEECIKRDRLRNNKSVGFSVIRNMAYRLGLIPHVKTIIVDIDGTLADCEERKKKATKPDGKLDWKVFFNEAAVYLDKFRKDVYDDAKKFAEDNGCKMVLVSGRPETLKHVTEAWLKHNCVEYERLIMRYSGDHRPDTEVKKQILDENFDKTLVLACWDDRPCVIRMWQENGIKVFDVGNGIEF